MMRRIRPSLLALTLVASVTGATEVSAQTPAPGTTTPAAATRPTVTAIRSWSSPTGTRIVMEFSALVAHVAPDSGLSRNVLVTIPEPVARGAEVQEVLRVGDGLVDSVLTLTADDGTRFHVWFRDTTRFRIFTLPAGEDRPYRLVVDAAKPGAAHAEVKRLEGIAAQKRKEKIRVVAVDPGHGGEDSGARAPRSIGLLEKNACLAIARAVVGELNKTPGVRAVLTRTSDYFVPLRDRYRLAEKMKADVFVSIHANSTRRRNSGNGTEVYFLSLRGAGDQADEDLADLENAADLVGGVPEQSENQLVNILYDVKRSSALAQSQLLAETVLDEVASDRRLESRGVKQAGFVVLKSVEFPSILVETAFINNTKEARLLKSKEFQNTIAKQIADGVKTYFKRARIGVSGDTEGSGVPIGG
jgi:N-acetylmuramoyl-L-alanine amidase